MKYLSNVDSSFREKNVGKSKVIYRLLSSVNDYECYHLLITSVSKKEIRDHFVPHLSSKRKDAEKTLDFMYFNSVTPLTADEILDEYISSK